MTELYILFLIIIKKDPPRHPDKEEYNGLPGGGAAHGGRGLAEATVGFHDDDDIQQAGAVERKAPDELLLFRDLHVGLATGKRVRARLRISYSLSMFLSSPLLWSSLYDCCHGAPDVPGVPPTSPLTTII